MRVAKFFIPVVVVVAFSRCETIIDVDLPKEDPAIVLNSFFGTDTTYIVALHQSKDILDNSYDFKTISGASLELYEENRQLGTFIEDLDQPGIYRLDQYPIAGIKYTVHVTRQGFESVEASDMIPDKLTNPSVEELSTKRNSYGEEINVLTYAFTDNPGTDYYEVLLFAYSPKYEHHYDEDTSYQQLVGYQKDTDPVYYNKAGAELNEFEDTEDPTIFSDELFDRKRHSNTIEFYFHNYNGDGSNEQEKVKFCLDVRLVSQAYFQYKKSLQLQFNSDDNPFAEAALVYNNIQNGYGIFAGYSVESVYFYLE